MSIFDKKKVIRRGSRVAGTGLVRFIYEGLKQNEKRTARNKLYCGDASYCSRKSVKFATEDGINNINAAALLYMEYGTVIHRLFQKGLDKAGVLVEAEQRVNFLYHDIELRGMIDGILKYDDEYCILEIKTCGALPSKPKKEHLHQALTYALLTGVYKVNIMYQSRKVAGFDGKLECVEFEFEVTQPQLEMVAEVLATSFVCTKRKVLPPIPSHIVSQGDCGFCPFTAFCWGPEAKIYPKLKPRIVEEIATAKRDLLRMSRKAHRKYS